MTLELLEKHGIREFAKAGYGDQLTQAHREKADITTCMNQGVYDECLQIVTFACWPACMVSRGYRRTGQDCPMPNRKGSFTEGYSREASIR